MSNFMKHLITALFICIIIVALFTSCKKEHVCECTYTTTLSGSSSSTYDSKKFKDKRKGAEASCKKEEKDFEYAGAQISIRCKLN